ncbi:DsbA family protein [Rhizobium sp. SSA_523]|uniref:DsbA family protein n=1 Tax=Rhizobium sp. SSA_523 TaxID=2952477 RepID=UPI002090D56B|nr:DsbA family protein [Rhizobium sp. SSA_523]MCO5730590.1 DsbA family protein [Rhizobium sp. SSA_523]WKC24576.1 DsbA family protein [Rhizobium sp. SSA_523]
MTPFSKLFTALLLAGSAAIAAAPPARALDDRQKEEIGAFIREYLIAHPEVMLEVQDALEKKSQELRAAQSANGIASNKAAIFNSPDDITVGNPQGDVTVVEFFDYNCGYCKRALTDMDEVLAKDKKVRFILKEFPILGPDSMAAHRVANAVRLVAPDKYLTFHRALLGGQARATEETALQVAAMLGIAEADIRQTMADKPNDPQVQATYELANALGISGTPFYVVGDEAVFGAVGHEDLLSKIGNIRSCGKTDC